MNKVIKENNKSSYSAKAKRTILIVEDGNINYVVLKKLILQIIPYGCEIHRAENGQLAVDFCKKNKQVDIVLMDIQMPIMDGFEASRKIKKKYPNLPIVMQSAYTSVENQKRAQDIGCNDFIFKPLQKDHVERVLNSYMCLEITAE